MSVYWMFMIFLGSKLFHGTHSTCTCNVKLEHICASGEEEVHVPCPMISADEMTLTLYKDREVIFNIKCNSENTTWKCPQSQSMVGVKLLEKPFSFILYELTNNSQGIYKCEGTTIYPPPIITVPSNVSIHVLVKENHCKCHRSISKPENPSLEVMWILVVVLLAFYSITVTTIALVIWLKLRKTDTQSDYMNTIPRAPRDRRRKRGIQTPIQRHF